MKVFDRQKKEDFEEKVYGKGAIDFFWGNSFFSKTVGRVVGWLFAHFSFVSILAGWFANSRFSRKEITRFIESYNVDAAEFLDPVESFDSFNAFFIRRLKKWVRPIDENPKSVVIPADGRYLFYQDGSVLESLEFKGKKWTLEWLLQDKELAKRYKTGAVVLGRLAPPDYHWFHFPCDGVPSEAKLVKGPLFSVNPQAIKQRPTIFCENKRRITRIECKFGEVIMLEIGATSVGSIHEIFTPNVSYKKGEPKGYFSFGGSQVVLLFEPGRVHLDPELLAKTKEGVEVKCLLGQVLGTFGAKVE